MLYQEISFIDPSDNPPGRSQPTQDHTEAPPLWSFTPLEISPPQRLFVDYKQTNWDTPLPLVEFAVNNHHHSATQQTPFYLNFGFSSQDTLFLL